MSKINAEIVADSVNVQGDRLTSVLVTMPRIILSEMNTHRMLSKNTSSSRAIPFKKMVESVENDPFIPIAWQKHHSGMQGNEYWDVTIKGEIGELDHTNIPAKWLRARDTAVTMAEVLHDGPQGVTKQLANRLLEPFMWTTMLITGPKSGWDNFFNLRCPSYELGIKDQSIYFKSKKDYQEFLKLNGFDYQISDENWKFLNQGQAEIHMMALAECIWDAYNESTPKQLKAGEWHIPFGGRITDDDLDENLHISKNLREKMSITNDEEQNKYWDRQDLLLNEARVKVSTAMAARTSYTVVGEEKGLDYEALIGLHDRLLAQDPPHSSPMEHACVCVSQEEYNNSFKGQEKGWFRNYKGFKSYRQVIEESK